MIAFSSVKSRGEGELILLFYYIGRVLFYKFDCYLKVLLATLLTEH